MDFNNLKVAFSDKSNSDLNRAYLLFKSISNPTISRILTSLLKIFLWLKIPISTIIKATVFKHFCGGTTIQDSQKTIEFLWKSKIGTILDYSAEGKKSEKDFNHVMEETIQTIYKAKSETSIPFSVFKFTGLTHISLLEKLSLELPLSKMEENEKKNFVNRVENICKTAAENKVPIFIDAEESWIQEAIDHLTLEMMRKFNKKGCWIYNTIQMYRKDRLNYLDKIIQISTKEKFFLGLKIVRGAYHQKEIERSKEKEYPTPVHLNKADTDRDYNEALKICIKNSKSISICAGTHNEKSSLLLSKLIKKNGFNKNDERFYFSQLLGMSDHISYNLSKNGYNVAKYVPYGPVKEVIPYLIRRAEENTSISGQMGRELSNLLSEKKRRKYQN
tara:strand:+ start:12404 stop:13570 length:1167 start_codon:yes stop_codon:yes gene_type:complete